MRTSIGRSFDFSRDFECFKLEEFRVRSFLRGPGFLDLYR